MKLKRFIELYKNFGSKVAFSALGASRFWKINYVKHRYILEYLKKNYSDFINKYKYKQEKIINLNNEKSSSTIWTLWWQGEKNLPDVVKICHSSIKKYRGSHDFKILTKDNWQEYITLPNYILEKFSGGAISITHLSDIMRFYLLFNYGGLWLDSTIFITNGIPENIFGANYYTVKRPLTPRNRNVAQDRWTNFLHAAKKGNFLCEFVLNFFFEYWKTQKTLIDYFLIDYAIQTAYDKIPECKKILDAVPVVNYDLYKLENLLNHEWSEEIFNSIKNSTNFSKLAWRKAGNIKTFTGKQTIYSHLLEEVNTNEN